MSCPPAVRPVPQRRMPDPEYVNLIGAHQDGPNGTHLDMPSSTRFSCACGPVGDGGFVSLAVSLGAVNAVRACIVLGRHGVLTEADSARNLGTFIRAPWMRSQWFCRKGL